MSIHRFVAASALAGLLLAQPHDVSAELVDHGSFTTDTVTGFDWLDLTETVGMSFDYVSGLIADGGALDGWRHATRAEIVQFWQSAGGEGPFTGAAKGDTEWVRALQGLWGKTYPFTYSVPMSNGTVVLQTSVAMTAEQSTTCPACNITVYIADNILVFDSSYGDLAEALQLNEAYRWDGQRAIGHALVKASANSVNFVPEPPVWSLLMVVVVLGLAKRVFYALRG